MRILLVTHGYPPFGLAGVERLAEQSAHGLGALGHEVNVLARRTSAAPPQPRVEQTTHDGVSVTLVSGGGPGVGVFPYFDAQLERIFERCLIELRIDVVLVSHLLYHSPQYVAIAHRWRIPVVLELHDFFAACGRAHLQRVNGGLCDGPDGGRACARYCFMDQPRAASRWALRTHMFRRALDEADTLLCPSRFVADYFVANFGVEQAPRVIGNGVDSDVAGPANRAVTRHRRDSGTALRLASVGVLVPHKGINVVLEALRIARIGEVSYVVFGETTEPYLSELRDSAAGVSGLEFKAYGRFEPSELPFLLGNVDAVVIPSIVWETYSIVAREALACGVPVIASRLGALSEAVRDGENGLLFDPHDTAGLGSILSGLASDRSRIDALRDGIRSSDWLSATQRAREVSAILEEVRSLGVVHGQGVREEAELISLRDGLVKRRPRVTTMQCIS